MNLIVERRVSLLVTGVLVAGLAVLAGPTARADSNSVREEAAATRAAPAPEPAPALEAAGALDPAFAVAPLQAAAAPMAERHPSWGLATNLGFGGAGGDFGGLLQKPVAGDFNLFRDHGKWRLGLGIRFNAVPMKEPYPDEDG